eukprot:5139689-Alexandrium_andersonii.AAC.1
MGAQLSTMASRRPWTSVLSSPAPFLRHWMGVAPGPLRALKARPLPPGALSLAVLFSCLAAT